MMRKVLTKHFLLLVVFFLSILSFSSLIRRGYFPMHDDMQAMRVLQLDKCLRDGQIPCRWVPDMGNGYGYPQFNYYSPLPYYVMEGFHLLGFSILDSVKIGFVLSFLFSSLAMYFFGRLIWGDWGGLVSAVFYLYAPYRAMDVYNRGAMGEAWAFVFLPLIFYAVRQFVREKKGKYLFLLALAGAGLFLSHNITTMIFLPFVFLWAGICLYLQRDKSRIVPLVLGFAWGIGLSAFFVLPAVLEKKFAHTETMLTGYFNYLAHFISLKQLFLSTHWGYGSSVLGPEDDVNFSIGIFHWLFALAGTISLWISFRKKKKETLIATFLLFAGLATAFLTHQKSTFIWQKIRILEWLQFPWRFLTLSVFFFSAAAGGIIWLVKAEKKKKILAGFLIILVMLVNARYFSPASWIKIDDQQKFSGQLWEKQLTISIFDYLPIFAQMPPAEKAPEGPSAVSGEIKVLNFQKGTNWQKGEVEVLSDKASVRLPLFYFPGWQVRIDGKNAALDYHNYLGLITFDVLKGKHQFTVRLTDTWPRRIGNYLTLFSWLVLIFFVFRKRWLKR